ncbi:MAG: hypothetical protein HND56_07105 [Pseudomonadota bacterium]|nr:hypothetical protein [Pseudomonadota bacterium]QKK05464.1 MAG: hypothetical protein HND56_07105 [Pseudomonadota bacterium]
MFKPDDILEKKMREYTEQQDKNFADALQKFQYRTPDDTYEEGDENREKPFTDILLKLKSPTRARNSAALLEDIARKGLVITAAYLFDEEHVFKPGALEQAVLIAAENNYPETAVFFLKHMEDWSGVFFQKVMENVNNDDTRRRLEAFHNDYVENSRPDWIPEAGYNDAERLQNSDLRAVMQERRLWCVYQFLQKGHTPEKEDFLALIKGGESRNDTADFIRAFVKYDQGASTTKWRNETAYMMINGYLKNRRDGRSDKTDNNLTSLAHLFNDSLQQRAKDKYAFFLHGDIPGLMQAGAGRDPLAQIFDSLPQEERQKVLLTVHNQAQEEQNLDILYWFHTTELLNGVADPDIFGNLLKCVEQLGQDDDYNAQQRLKSACERYIKLLAPEELTAQNGILLKTVVEKRETDLLRNLIQRNADWPHPLVEQKMTDAVYAGDGTILNLLCQMKQDWQIAFIKNCGNMPSANKRNIESEVSSIKRSFMEDWSARNKNEISRSIRVDSVTITHLFNFQSAQLITTTSTYEGKGAALEITNFRDVQNGDEIDEAYAKLRIMYDDAPPYKCKDDSTRQHVIRRRNTNSR